MKVGGGRLQEGGGLREGGGGASEVLPLQKGEQEKFSHAEGRSQQVLR